MKTLRLLFVALVAIMFGYFLYVTDFQESWIAIKQIGTGFLWILCSTFAAYLLGTLGWRYCLKASPSRVPLHRLFAYRHIGDTLALFNPTSVLAGDYLKSKYLQRHGVDTDTAVTSVTLSRALMVISQLVLMALTLIWLLYESMSRSADSLFVPLATVLFLIIVVLAGGTWLVTKPTEAPAGLTSAASRWQRVKHQVRKFQMLLAHYIRNHPKDTLLAFLFFMAHWVVGSIEIYIILHYLGYPVSLWSGIFMDMGIVVVKSMGAFIPGQLGIEELGNKLVLSLIGISSYGVWLTLSVLRRARQLAWSVVGFLLYGLLPQKASLGTTKESA